MLDIEYYRDEAEKYRKLAEQTADDEVRQELLELAAVCERVANRIEERLPAG
jgi:predicted kinase